jgi:hypothetical protein
MIAMAAAAAFFLMRGKQDDAPLVIPEEDLPPPPPQAPSYTPPPPCIDNCGADGYDTVMWGSRADIINGFAYLGYQTPDDRDTMNALGADGELGGTTPEDRDVKSAVVESFQRAYNRVSTGNKLTRSHYGGNRPMGLLRPDGYVGPKTLNGLQMILLNVPDSVSPPGQTAGEEISAAELAAVAAWWQQLSA